MKSKCEATDEFSYRAFKMDFFLNTTVHYYQGIGGMARRLSSFYIHSYPPI